MDLFYNKATLKPPTPHLILVKQNDQLSNPQDNLHFPVCV